MRLKGEEVIDRGRRALLRGRLPEAASVPLGSPPPALTAELAATLPCHGCPAPCAGVCEPGIIRLHPAGHALAGQPYLSFEDAGCTFCNACVKACPLEAGDDVPPARLGTAVLDRDACIAWDGVICMSCRFACPERAIAMDGRSRPGVEQDACTGCGMCVNVCPTRAIRVAF